MTSPFREGAGRADAEPPLADPGVSAQQGADPALLHIYGQGAWHDDVFVVGNGEALLALRAAVDRALAAPDGRGLAREVYTNDGEGYDIHVLRLDDPWIGLPAGSRWVRLAVPYNADYAAERRSDNAIGPWQLFSLPDPPTVIANGAATAVREKTERVPVPVPRAVRIPGGRFAPVHRLP